MRIALFEPDIPQNAGNIFRLGACLGVSIDIIEPAGFVIDDKRLKRASMDYYDYLDLTKHLSWEKFYEWSKKNSYRLILLTTKSTKSYYNYKFQTNDIILFGMFVIAIVASISLAITMTQAPKLLPQNKI